jgi:hypothetical protein
VETATVPAGLRLDRDGPMSLVGRFGDQIAKHDGGHWMPTAEKCEPARPRRGHRAADRTGRRGNGAE